MKRILLAMLLLCFITVSCTKNISEDNSYKDSSEAAAPVKTQNKLGSFRENISFYREFDDKIMIQAEQEESFDVYSFDMDEPSLKLSYKTKSQDDLLYLKQLDADTILKVKQMGNGEENNHLVLEGKISKTIAKNIAYSGTALVTVSPNQRYIAYCIANEIQNHYGLYLYDMESQKTVQLMDLAYEELLNDMDWNLCWSPDNTCIVVSNRLVLQASSGKLIREIDGENVLWSAASDKLAYIRPEKGNGKAICILDILSGAIEEVFIVNQGEYLPGYMVWNAEATKLAFVTADINEGASSLEAGLYKSLYSLDIKNKQALRIDTALAMEAGEMVRLQGVQYNPQGSVLAVATENFSGTDLYVYQLNTGEGSFFTNIEYLHSENNESYLCSAGQYLYFVQGQSILELDEQLNSKQIYHATAVIDDFYISKKGQSMLIIEQTQNETVLQHLSNFAKKDI